MKSQSILLPFSLLIVAIKCFSIWETDTDSKIILLNNGQYNPYREFNQFLNDFFFNNFKLNFIQNYLSTNLNHEYAYYVESYLRDLILGSLVYWLTAGIWHIVLYRINGDKYFVKKGRPFPTTETITDQMKLAQASLLLYAGLPILSEFLIENNLTKTYFYIDQVGGWKQYVAYLLLYIVFVEVGIYWMHRTLHENKFLYKYVHSLHHKYNKSSTLTPWASIAFNPLDGLLQARF
jgi:lathosterol oxidase